MTFKQLIYEKYKMNFNYLAKKSGVKATTLRNIDERNSFFNTNLNIIIKIAKALNTSVDILISQMNEE